MTNEATEPARGTYHRHRATDDYGEDEGKDDVRWHTPDGRLTWVVGIQRDFLDALEAQLKASQDENVRLREALTNIRQLASEHYGAVLFRKLADVALNPETNAEPGQET